MKCEIKNKLNPTNNWKNWKMLSGLFLLVLFVFTMVVSAEIEDSSDVSMSSAGASASANGDIATTITQAIVTENGAAASATARAMATNGGIATAIAEAWANFLDRATAYAKATSTVTAGIGETAWAEANVDVSALPDGTATSNAESIVCIGENCLDKGDDNGDNKGDNNPGNIDMTTSTSISTGTGGAVYSFGNSDVERYCHFKLQLDDKDPTNDERANYYINILVWDNGFSDAKHLEQKYNIACSSDQLVLKDRIK